MVWRVATFLILLAALVLSIAGDRTGDGVIVLVLLAVDAAIIAAAVRRARGE